ncbi:hypothetical protein BCV00_04005 [Vibrio breoganii]|nr:hypothetical protein BCV00_04005 [Vibrio breoganii]
MLLMIINNWTDSQYSGQIAGGELSADRKQPEKRHSRMSLAGIWERNDFQIPAKDLGNDGSRSNFNLPAGKQHDDCAAAALNLEACS